MGSNIDLFSRQWYKVSDRHCLRASQIFFSICPNLIFDLGKKKSVRRPSIAVAVAVAPSVGTSAKSGCATMSERARERERERSPEGRKEKQVSERARERAGEPFRNRTNFPVVGVAAAPRAPAAVSLSLRQSVSQPASSFEPKLCPQWREGHFSRSLQKVLIYE